MRFYKSLRVTIVKVHYSRENGEIKTLEHDWGSELCRGQGVLIHVSQGEYGLKYQLNGTY